MHGIATKGSLRRRLTVAFMLAAGLAPALLAAGSFLLVRSSRLSDSLDRGLDQTRANLVLASTVLDRAANRAAAERLLASSFQRRGSFDTVGFVGDRGFALGLSVGPGQVPADLRAVVQTGRLGYERTRIAGTHYLVTGGQPAGSQVELYFFFTEQRLYDDLRQLAFVLFGGTGVLILLAGLAGAALARRTLRPVGQASAAARSLAEGLLDTRLPVEREDEFGRWAASFNGMAEALQDKVRALSEAEARERRFTADVAHELRTPLTALVAEASLLREHIASLPPAARRPAELLAEDVERLRRLVDDLLEVSRLDAGHEDATLEPIDLRGLVDGLLAARSWRDRVHVEGSRVIVPGDRGRLERILGNLVGNALQHGGRGVSVTIEKVNGEARLEVADSGPGIAQEHLPHVFDRFYKADRSRSGAGSGLGLAIARENARLLGGDIEAWSEPGRGSRFTVRLPAVAEPLHEREPLVAHEQEDGDRCPRRSSR
jgi:signal transduction histidine kinase